MYKWVTDFNHSNPKKVKWQKGVKYQFSAGVQQFKKTMNPAILTVLFFKYFKMLWYFNIKWQVCSVTEFSW